MGHDCPSPFRPMSSHPTIGATLTVSHGPDASQREFKGKAALDCINSVHFVCFDSNSGERVRP